MSRIAGRIAGPWLALAALACPAGADGPPGGGDRLRGLGVERISGVRESGFHDPEGDTEANAFRWTDGNARLVIPVPASDKPPALLHLRLGLNIPRPTRLVIRANGTTLFDQTVAPRGEWARVFDLRDAVRAGPVDLEIRSDRFVPAELRKESDDDRTLGVQVRGVALLDAVRDVSGVNLAVEPVPGVELTGVHQVERPGPDAFRWTDSSTRLVVPVPEGRRWKTLTVRLETPDRPNWRVRVAVNGRTLADDVGLPERSWTRALSLEGVDPGRSAVIELTTPAIPPGQSRSKDGRALGVRLREVTLRGE